MLKISHALIIDDKINLLTENQNDNIFVNNEYRSLMNIHNYFLKNSIPLSVINNFSTNPMDAIESISIIPRPDIVVLDLDLNSDGIIDDDDINLIGLILNKLISQFGQYILFIYSSQTEEWEIISPQLLSNYPSLQAILETNNIIIFEKYFESTVAIDEKISVEIYNKKKSYFQTTLNYIDSKVYKMWNKEVAVFSLFISGFLFAGHYILKDSDNTLFIMSLLIILIVSLKFIYANDTNTKTKEK